MKDYAALEQWLAMGTRVYTITGYVQGLPCGNATKQPLPPGHGRAQTNLGVLSSLGLGMPQDHTWAYMWRRFAAVPLASAVHTFPVDHGDEVARRMTSAQMAEAPQLPHQCQPQQFKGC